MLLKLFFLIPTIFPQGFSPFASGSVCARECIQHVPLSTPAVSGRNSDASEACKRCCHVSCETQLYAAVVWPHTACACVQDQPSPRACSQPSVEEKVASSFSEAESQTCVIECLRRESVCVCWKGRSNGERRSGGELQFHTRVSSSQQLSASRPNMGTVLLSTVLGFK